FAAPARMEDLRSLPRTYLTVNELDCLRDEGLDYARRLLQVGVPTDVRCWAGTFHGFASAVPDADISRHSSWSLYRAMARGLRIDALAEGDSFGANSSNGQAR